MATGREYLDSIIRLADDLRQSFDELDELLVEEDAVEYLRDSLSRIDNDLAYLVSEVEETLDLLREA